MAATSRSPRPTIGVFDSGLGGLSVLRAIHRHCPGHPLLYVADSGHAPYGERGDAYVSARSDAIADFLIAQGSELLVVACNTATAAAIAPLRARMPDRAIVGVEPGLKPAAQLSRNGKVGVMATSGTLQSEKFLLLAQAHAAHVELVLQACPGLAHAIEGGDAESSEVLDQVRRHTAPLVAAEVDTVVLGCTHYPFVAHHIQAAMGPHVQLVDTSDAVALRVAGLCAPGSARGSDAATPPARLWTTGNAATLQGFAQRWLGFPYVIEDGGPA